MLDLLSQGWFGSLMGLLGLIVGIVGLILYRNSRIGARPICTMSGLHLIGKAEQKLPSEVEIYYNGKKVHRLSQTHVILWNDGKATIQGDQIVSSDPLRLIFDEGTEILQASIAAVTRKVNNAKVLFYGPLNYADICFDYLDPGDGIRLELLHTSEKPYPKLLGSIKGIPKGVIIKEPSIISSNNNSNTFVNLLIIFSTGLFLLIVGLLPSPWILKTFNILYFNIGDPKLTVVGFRLLPIITGVLFIILSCALLFLNRKIYPVQLDPNINAAYTL